VKADDHSRWGHLKFGQRGESFKGYTEYGQKPRANAQRPARLGPDIIDQFHLIGTGFLVSLNALIGPAGDSLCCQQNCMDEMARREPLAKDLTLAAPYEGILGRISELEKLEPAAGSSKRTQLKLITGVVDDARVRHLQRMTEGARRKSQARSFPNGCLTFTSLPIVERQDILRSLSAEYAADVHAVFMKCPSFDTISSIRKIAASYAYLSTYNKKRESRLALLVAFDSSGDSSRPF
jgi:hypothetical protein